MNRPAYIFRQQRRYHDRVANPALEDYALRHVAETARRWRARKVAGAALGPSASLSYEAIGAAITLAYGSSTAFAAIAASVVLMILTAMPIAYHAARSGLSIDLLTRGTGFGYLGATINSLIFASFTLLLFAVDAGIMAAAVRALTALPLPLCYIVSTLAVLPIAWHGMRAMTRFQAMTQPFWLVLQLLPFAYLFWDATVLNDWGELAGGAVSFAESGSALIPFGMAMSMLLVLLPHIGTQADMLRFMPSKERIGAWKWWVCVMAGGPGAAMVGGVKMLLGSILAASFLSLNGNVAGASQPLHLFASAPPNIAGDGRVLLAVAALFVILCQMKVNVANAYAGSLAWSNFFARMTQSHPGRVAWLLFHVVLALLLMNVGLYAILDTVLALYTILAATWFGALVGDLVIARPLGLVPHEIAFRRAHLYDINPVGPGAMLLAVVVAGLASAGWFGLAAHAFAPLIGLTIAFVAAPVVALALRGRFYLAREDWLGGAADEVRCAVCDMAFEPRDMAHCPVHSAPICSLCCTLEARCHDRCKRDSRAGEQGRALVTRILPPALLRCAQSTFFRSVAVMLCFAVIAALAMWIIYSGYTADYPQSVPYVRDVLWIVFVGLTTMSGVAAWVLVLAHDSRKIAERDTRNHVDQLIAEISAHQATDAELQRAKAAAESANQAKSRFLASVSHEIRSPLNSIYGYAQLLERDEGVGALQAAKVIRRSSEHLSNLVEGLLDISQVESGVLRLSRDTIRFPAFLEQIADMFEPQAAAQGLEFLFQRPKHLPEFVRADQKRLRQVLINLLSNALKFTQEGSVSFKVQYRSELATFEVSDTGSGIAREDLERVFRPFERGTGVSPHSHHGVGLGLAITQALVHIMGGEIKLASEPGEGSRFTVRVMLTQPHSQPVETTPASAITGYEGPRRTILTVDDDPVQLTMLRTFLEPLGFIVVPARDGESGVAVAAQVEPDLALLDISLPGMSGWETAKALRKRHGRDLRIVMVSADANEIGDGGEVNDMFLTKPVEFAMLLDAITNQLGIRWTGSEGGGSPPGNAPVKAAAHRRQVPAEARPYLAEIERLARIGYVRGIEAQIDALAETLPDASHIVSEMRVCLDAFDLKALAAIAREGQRNAG